MSTAPSAVSFDNVAELLERLGNVPPARVRLRPPPGQATEEDLLAALARKECLFELIDGTLVEKAVGFKEAFVASAITCAIGNFAEENDLGFVVGARGTMRLREGVVRTSCVSFFSWDRFPDRLLPREPIPECAPDLAVEVLREGNTAEEMERKLREYFLAGVRLVWIVDPARRAADVYTKPDAPDTTVTEKEALDGGDVLPGFRLPLAELFARLPAPPKKARPPRRKKS